MICPVMSCMHNNKTLIECLTACNKCICHIEQCMLQEIHYAVLYKVVVFVLCDFFFTLPLFLLYINLSTNNGAVFGTNRQN